MPVNEDGRVNISDDLEMRLEMATSGSMAEMVSYLIFGAVATTSRAFKKVTLKIDPRTQRVFVAIELKWWARMKRLSGFRMRWLQRAEEAARPHVPDGWRMLVYYNVPGVK